MNDLLAKTFLALGLAATGALAHAAPGGCPGLFMTGGYVRAPAPGAGTVAAYGTLENSTANPITLTGVTAEGFSSAMLHRSTSANGMAGMAEMGNVVVPAKGSVELAPGGSHIMLTGPTGQLRAKDTVRLKLQCGAGAQQVLLPVEAPKS